MATREENLQAAHKMLEEQVAELRTSDAWVAWLRFGARFHSYSFNNLLMILAQRPTATHVAGFRRWQDLGRQVRKGEHGIAIYAPIIRKLREDEEGYPGQRLVGFRLTYVFDVEQTDGEAIPSSPAASIGPLSGTAPDGLWDSLATIVTGNDYRLTRGDCGDAYGWTDFTARRIQVRADVDDLQAVKTLIHEIAHMWMHKPGSTCRGLGEVEAESVAFVVATHLGLDTSTYSFPYVAHWGDDDDVAKTGQNVIKTAHRIIDHLEKAAVATVAA